MIIAIDGPAGSGKGTLARKLAIHFKLPHLDSGKPYRYVALTADELGLEPTQNERLTTIVRNISTAVLDNPRLSSGRAGTLAAKYSKAKTVRDQITQFIRNFASGQGGAVVDGRDIGTVVLPKANIKLFVTASPEIRARRRFAELSSIGHEADYDSILKDLRDRDRADMERKIAPLVPAGDAHLLDTTDLNIEATFDAAIAIVKAAQREQRCG